MLRSSGLGGRFRDMVGLLIGTDTLFGCLVEAGHALDRHICYAYEGKFHFILDEGLTIAVSVDSADRLRIETCQRGKVLDTLWCQAADHPRLAQVVQELRDETGDVCAHAR